MRKYYLTTIYDRFGREADWLLVEFTSAMTTINSNLGHKASRLSAESPPVRLHDCWGRFSPDLAILSAGGRPMTANGQTVDLAPGVHSPTQVIPAYLATFKKNTSEPNWAVPDKTIEAAQRLKIRNYTTVSAAIGAMNSPAEEIRPIRNFLVHRNTANALEWRRKIGRTYRGQLSVEVVAGAYVNPGLIQFEKWVIDLKNVALSAIQ